MSGPYGHLKVKNLERVIGYLRQSNDKDAQQEKKRQQAELEMQKRMKKAQAPNKSAERTSQNRTARTAGISANSRKVSREKSAARSRRKRSLEVTTYNNKSASKPFITGIEQKLYERQKKKDAQSFHKRMGFSGELQSTKYESSSNFDVVNHLYDKTSNYLQKGKLNYMEPLMFSQSKVTEKSSENEQVEE